MMKVIYEPRPAGDKYFFIDKSTTLVVGEWRGIDGQIVAKTKKLGDAFELGIPATVALKTIASLGKLVRITSLCLDDLNESSIESISPSMTGGALNRLRCLHLQNSSIESLPPAISRLHNLKALNLARSSIIFLPSSFGSLLNLEKLNLCFTEQLWKLPDEFGNLANLKELQLVGSAVVLLPDSIGKLKSLKVLDMSQTPIKSLPSSIGNLEKLECLWLARVKSLRLPEEIGNLSNLKALSFVGSGITCLPDSLEKLQGLMCILLQGSSLSELQLNDPNEFLLMLTQQFKYLGYLGVDMEKNKETLRYELACNRARWRTRFGIVKEGSMRPMVPKLWPLVLKDARSAFGSYSKNQFPRGSIYPRQDNTTKADAVYRLLLDGRELFMMALLSKNHRKNY